MDMKFELPEVTRQMTKTNLRVDKKLQSRDNPLEVTVFLEIVSLQLVKSIESSHVIDSLYVECLFPGSQGRLLETAPTVPLLSRYLYGHKFPIPLDKKQIEVLKSTQTKHQIKFLIVRPATDEFECGEIG